jgi:hypothetical protein
MQENILTNLNYKKSYKYNQNIMKSKNEMYNRETLIVSFLILINYKELIDLTIFKFYLKK